MYSLLDTRKESSLKHIVYALIFITVVIISTYYLYFLHIQEEYSLPEQLFS